MQIFAMVLAAVLASVASNSERQTFVVQDVSDVGQQAAIGSGVVVAKDGDVLTIATAAHIVMPGRHLEVLDETRRALYDVIDSKMLPDYDLLLIHVRAQPQFHVEPPAIAAPEAGESVYVWGNPGNSFWEMTTGTVQRAAAVLPGEHGDPRITITCDACDHGNSGSGVFNRRGELIGILTAGWKDRAGKVAFLEVQPAALILRTLLAMR